MLQYFSFAQGSSRVKKYVKHFLLMSATRLLMSQTHGHKQKQIAVQRERFFLLQMSSQLQSKRLQLLIRLEADMC